MNFPSPSMPPKSPSLREKHLSFESLESRQMMSGTALTPMQQETVQAAHMVLRGDPVELLEGAKEFSSATVECIADSPVFTDGSFTIEASVRPNAIRAQVLVSKYNSQSEPGQSFILTMLADGRLRFCVYGNPAANEMQMTETDGALQAGVWQKVQASFDIQSQKMSLMVDGVAVPATQVEGLPPVTAIYDSVSPVRVGDTIFGGGRSWIYEGGMENITYYPVQSFDAQEEAAATDAVIAEEETPAEPVAEEQQTTVAAIDAVLRAEPVALLSGTREFNGSSMECIADSPVFTDGSFALETQIRVNAIQQQSIITKYDSGAEDRSFHFCMLNTGQLQFDVFGDAEGRSYLTFRTTGTPLAVGQWQTVRAIFDLEHRQLSITVDGQDVPGETIQTGADITALYDSKTAVRVGGRRTGGGDGNYLNAGIQDARFSPIASFVAQTQTDTAAAEEEAALPLTEAEAEELTTVADTTVTTPAEGQEATRLPSEQTTEQAALSLTERQVQQYEKRMAGANERLAGCEAALQSAQDEVQSLEQTIASASQTIAAADGVLQKAALEAQMEKNVGTSSFRIDGIFPNRTIWLNYTDMPAGYDAVMFGSGFGEREAMPAGSGTVDFGIPQGIAADAQIGIMKHGTNEVVGTLVDFRILKGYVRENVDDRSIALPGLSAVRTISAEEVGQRQKERSGAAEQLAKAESALPQAQADAAQALLDWQAAQRETIAYGSITGIEPQVTELRSGEIRVGFRVHYRSPDADSRMEVYRDGMRLSLTELSHPAGQPDGAFVYAPEDGSWHGDLEFRYFSRGANGMRQVDSATATYNTRESLQNAARVTSTFNNLTSHDTGRLVDTPLPYDVKVMSVRGSSAVLHFTSPDDESVITSSTGGLYGQEMHSHPGGTTTGVALLTLTPNTPGQYAFSLQDRSGTVRDTVTVQWDGSVLTVMDAQDQWSADGASLARSASLSALGSDGTPAERIAQTLTEETTELLEQERLELLLEKQINLSTNPIIDGVNRALWETQAQDLYERSSLFVSPEKMHEYFFTVHPDWRPENFQATVMRMWQDGGSKGQSGDTRDWLNGVILDQLNRFDRDLHIFSAAAAEIMQKGVRACIAIRQGQNEGPLFRELEELITSRNYWEAVGRLKGIGVLLPTRHQVIAEANRIVAQRIDDLVFKDSEDTRLHDNYAARQRSGIWSAEIDGKVNVSVLAERRTVARGYTQQEVSENEARRRQRAADLVLRARLENDPRAQMSVAISDDSNIQRERQLANGTTQITITTAEAERMADRVDEVIEAGNGDLDVVSRELVASLHYAPDAEGTEAIAEQIGEIPAGEDMKGEITMRPEAGKKISSTFTLTEKKMVNLWASPGKPSFGGIHTSLPPNYSLILSGTTVDGHTVGPYTSGKSVASAESVSLALLPGTYTITVRDDSTFDCAPSATSVQYEIKPYRSQKIEGMVSIEGRDVAMPVSMSVAEFENGQRITDYNKVSELDPSKPVWVVVHGRGNSEESSQIAELTKNLHALGAQVATVDWRDGAADNATPIGLEGSRWIESVGTWVTNQLQAAGFSTQNICLVGHSWGAYVAYEIGKRTPGGVQTLIALDPAADSKLLGGGKYKGIEDPNFSFANIAANSYAFHSSTFGDRNRALTAQYAFSIVAPENYEQGSWDAAAAQMVASQHYFTALGIETADELRDAYNEHGFAVSLFSGLLRRQKENPSDVIANRFSLPNLRSNAAEFSARENNWEGCFYANPSLTTFTSGADNGKQAWIANAYQFYSQDENGSPILGN